MKTQNALHKGSITAMIAISMLIGAISGGILLSKSQVNAQSTTPAATTTTAVTEKNDVETNDDGQKMKSGTFKPNEDPAHEKGESAAREAQEDAGQFPTVK